MNNISITHYKVTFHLEKNVINPVVSICYSIWLQNFFLLSYKQENANI